MVSPVFKCELVTKSYGAMKAVDSLSLSAYSGEVIGIAGPNGAGKTTLFDLFSGVQKPDSGEMYLNNKLITNLGADKLCKLGISRVFQTNAIFESLTVSENIAVSAVFGTNKSKTLTFKITNEHEQILEKMIEMFDLGDITNQIAANISIVERKKLMFASALASGTQLLLLDEPVGGLSAEEQKIILNYLEVIKKLNLTIIVVEHVMSFLLNIATKIMVMHHGQKIFEGNPKEFMTNKEVISIYLGEKTARKLANESI